MDSRPKIFRLSLARQLSVSTLIAGLAVLIVAIALIHPIPGDRKYLTLPLIALATLAVIAWLLYRHQSLAVSDKGVSIKHIGYTTHIAWEDIDDIEFRHPAHIVFHQQPAQSGSDITHTLSTDSVPEPAMNRSDKLRVISLRRYQHHIDSGNLPKLIRRSQPAISPSRFSRQNSVPQ